MELCGMCLFLDVVAAGGSARPMATIFAVCL
jgi:hypothetical protein